MTLATNERGDIVLARKHRYRLSDLIAQCDPKAAPPSDIELWESAKPAGREIE
jgi:antitoxin ChpS